MHTFFINTSKYVFENIDDILEMQIETKKFIRYDVPLSLWFDSEKGYMDCVRKIGKDIDDYKEIGDDYNLVVYVNFSEIQAYTEALKAGVTSIVHTTEALKILLRKIVSDTIRMRLDEDGRTPHEVLVIFEEEEYSGNVTLSPDGVIDALLRLLGYPSLKETVRIVEENKGLNEEARRKSFFDYVEANRGAVAIPEAIEVFGDDVRSFLNGISSFSLDLKGVIKEAQALSRNVCDNDVKLSKLIKTTSFYTAQRSIERNRQARARRDMQMYMYLWDITDMGSVTAESGNQGKPFPVMTDEKWEIVEKWLQSKYTVYSEKLSEIDDFGKYSHTTNLVLVPKMQEFDYKKFGLQRSGDPELEITGQLSEEPDETEEDEKDKSNNENNDDADGDGMVAEDTTKYTIFVGRKYATPLLTETGHGYKPFVASVTPEGLSKNPSTQKEYEATANGIYASMLEYFGQLRLHMSSVLPRYAAKGPNNASAILPKRRVTVSNANFANNISRCNWGNGRENDDLTGDELISARAYETVELEYLKFCTYRKMRISDIKEQTEWVNARIAGADKSRKNMLRAIPWITAGAVASFLPFIIIQWDAIFSGLHGIAVCGATIAGAVALLCSLTAALLPTRKKLFSGAWEEYKKTVKKARSEATVALDSYDCFLSRVIPSLRWVYEYKLDVQFYLDCCKVASKKLAHHHKKSNSRATLTHNLLTDLGVDVTYLDNGDTDTISKNINFAVSYCADDVNRTFYSVVDRELIDRLTDKA